MNEVEIVFNFLEGLFSNPVFTNVFSALLGAVAGSVTGYIFNRQLEKSRTQERYLIQRKNTIYSPIYKELLALKVYLHEVLEGEARTWRKYTISVDLIERSYTRGFKFTIWEDIKKDIRKSYIDSERRAKLEDVTAMIRKQQILQEAISSDLRKTANHFTHLHEEALKEVTQNRTPPNPENSIPTILGDYILPPDNSTTDYKQRLVQELSNCYTFSPTEAELHAKGLLRKAESLSSFKRLIPELEALINCVDDVTQAFEEKINYIINEYEGEI